MSTKTDIEKWGFYPAIVERALTRALGGEEPRALIHQIDAAFDHGSMFRHLTLAALGTDVFVHIHVDELENGGAGVATAVHPLDALTGLSVMEYVAGPENGGNPSEITISLNLGGTKRMEILPGACEDPDCTADHGWQGPVFPDDLTIRIADAAEGSGAVERAQVFVDALCAAIARRPGRD